MGKKMTEKDVLDALKIKDFRHMSKDKVMTAFSSMLPNMSPEVAIKVLDQFPSFAQAMTDIAVGYKEELSQSVESSNVTTQQALASCQTIIDVLSKELEKDELPFEEKKYFVEQMQQAGQLIIELQENHNKFLLKCIRYGLLTIVTVGGVMLTALGGDLHLTMP